MIIQRLQEFISKNVNKIKMPLMNQSKIIPSVMKSSVREEHILKGNINPALSMNQNPNPINNVRHSSSIHLFNIAGGRPFYKSVPFNLHNKPLFTLKFFAVVYIGFCLPFVPAYLLAYKRFS